MTQFLRAVSENRMEQALALAQTILKFEPRNAIILDYQATLAQYINNERELASVREEDADDDDDDNGDDNDDGGSGDEAGNAADVSSSTATGSDDGSTEEASAEEISGEDKDVAGAPRGDAPCQVAQKASRQGSVHDKQELQRLGGVLRDLRKTREARSQEIESRWDEDKFAASQREVEAVLRKFLPDAARQAAEKRAADGAPDQRHSETAK
ncbi:unnamed protein product [Ectocarpus sp. CCAP 1310/34]|nr:unnamed protein product [Ectocarpus sp. CCAP 1310/34]